MKLLPSALCLYAFVISCGSNASFPEANPSQSLPAITQISPSNVSVGDTVFIYGFGFSVVAPMNVVLLGELELVASTYEANNDSSVDAPEKISFVVPEDVVEGNASLSVFVVHSPEEGFASNTETITINP